jgi:hypothetical protein
VETHDDWHYDDTSTWDDTSSTDTTDDGGTVDFPDGSTVTDPYEDAQGQVYEDHDDYVHGTDAFEVTDPGTGEPGEATPSS